MPKSPKKKHFKRFKKRHPAHIVTLAFAMVMFWWGSWTVLDNLFLHNSTISGLISIIIALVIFYIDDFRLDELD